MIGRLLFAGCALAAGCISFSQSDPAYDSGLDGLAVIGVEPPLVLPGSTLVIEGRSFVDDLFGRTTVVVRGDNGGRTVELSLTPRFIDSNHLEVDLDDASIAGLGGPGELAGSVRVDVDSFIDLEAHSSADRELSLSVRETLIPRLDDIAGSGVLFVNDRIHIAADGLLLGGGEGTTYAVVTGCFSRAGDDPACAPIDPVEVEVTPETRFSRTRGQFPFDPAIAGIRSGRFVGRVALRNTHAGGARLDSGDAPVDYELIESVVFELSPGAASLGQYVDISGGGFIGGTPDALTLLALRGNFTPARGGQPVAVDTVLVPEFVEGRLVRYALNEDDAFGSLIDMRAETGSFAGELTPIISFRDDELTGDPLPFSLEIAPVKQVIWIDFTGQYVSALRDFGLRATDSLVRERVLEVVRRDYAGINVDLRTESPTDFAVYSIVEIGGADPNGLGLLGYDNTPGKDVGNVRLHDRLGGVNATTQLDGYPGYGGVFITSLFTFSTHPAGFAEPSEASAPEFDQIFNPLRPDVGGRPVTAADFAAGIDHLDSGDSCPAGDRRGQIACAVFALGNLIGTTLSHELGHSFGLAEPDSPTVIHPVSDAPNRIMDAGSYRPFVERAEIVGDGPARFCDGEYIYLRTILPTSAAMDTTRRPSCL